MFRNLFEFYRSKEWEEFRRLVIAERTREDGFVYDEVTNQPIVRRYDLILHHKEELTEENVFDFNISLNPENIMIVSHATHNRIHDNFGVVQKVWLVYGSPLSGKTEYVKQSKSEGDLIVDIDSIWECVSGCPRYEKPNRLKQIVFKIRNELLEGVKYRLGAWKNAYIVGGYPLTAERERLCKELGAREIYIDTQKDVCIERLEDSDRDKEKWRKYIEDWWSKYSPPMES